MKRILLVNAPRAAWFLRRGQIGEAPPMGLLALATYMQERGHDVRLIDLEAPPLTEEQFRVKLREFSPHIVGFAVTPTTWANTRTIIAMTRGELDGACIVAGGNFPTFRAETLMEEEPHLDYVVIGEGELTFQELASNLEGRSLPGAEQILGLCYRDGAGKPVRTARRELIASLDALPMHDRRLVNLPAYKEPFCIITARGCPARCTFCSNGAMFSRVRYRSVDSVLDEIKHLIDAHNMSLFFIADDTFTAKPVRVYEFCERLRSEVNRTLMWKCESRADVMTPELAQAMHDAGCFYVNIGLESADNTILRNIRKNVTVEQIEYATRCLCEHHMLCHLSFIFGHPGDTLETMHGLIRFVKGLIKEYPSYVYLSTLSNTPFPGTYQADHLAELGLQWHGKTWDDYDALKPFMSSDNFTLEELREVYMTAVETFIERMTYARERRAS